MNLQTKSLVEKIKKLILETKKARSRYPTEVREGIRSLVLEKGLTYKQIAKLTGISPYSVASWSQTPTEKIGKKSFRQVSLQENVGHSQDVTGIREVLLLMIHLKTKLVSV